MAKVSVLLPCYKPDVPHFTQALQSLITQTFTDWEATIVHQPSERDIRKEIAHELADNRITFIQSNVTRTIGENWNAVNAYAKCEYVQFLFHDDIWYPDYLDESVKILDTDASIGFTAAYHDYQYESDVNNTHLYEGIQTLRQAIAGKKHLGEEFLLQWLERGLHPNIIGEPPFVMMRKQHMDTVGPFNETLPQFLDSEYWTKLLMITNFYYLPESLGAFRVHPAAASAQNQQQGKGLTDRLITIEMLSTNGTPKVRQAAKQSLQNSLPRMIVKYRDRKKSGATTPGMAGTGMKDFLLRHPWLLVSSVIKAIIFKKQYGEENTTLERV